MGRIISGEIRNRCKIDNINTCIKVRKKERKSHIRRMSELRIIRIARGKSPIENIERDGTIFLYNWRTSSLSGLLLVSTNV